MPGFAQPVVVDGVVASRRKEMVDEAGFVRVLGSPVQHQRGWMEPTVGQVEEV